MNAAPIYNTSTTRRVFDIGICTNCKKVIHRVVYLESFSDWFHQDTGLTRCEGHTWKGQR